MISVQQLIHVLTGGNAAHVQQLAIDTVQQLFNNLNADGDRRTNICALGIGLHMYGDASAHQKMDSKSATMYTTGVGHAKDFSYPDYPLCDGYFDGVHLFQTCRNVVPNECDTKTTTSITRFCRWMRYPKDATLILGGTTNEPMLSVLAADLQKAASASNDRNHWGEDEVEINLLQDENLPDAVTAFFENQASSNYCQEVIRIAENDSPLGLNHQYPVNPSIMLSCAKIWNKYAKTIISEIAKAESRSQMVRERLDHVDWGKAYRCPLLDKAYKAATDEQCN